MKSCQVANSLPTGKEPPPVLGWRRMRRKGESFLPSTSLIKNTAKHSGKGKDGPGPSRHNGDKQTMLTSSFNLISRQWLIREVSLPVLCCFGLCVLLVHTETKLEIAVQNARIHQWGNKILQTFWGQFSTRPFPYSDTNAAPASPVE